MKRRASRLKGRDKQEEKRRKRKAEEREPEWGGEVEEGIQEELQKAGKREKEMDSLGEGRTNRNGRKKWSGKRKRGLKQTKSKILGEIRGKTKESEAVERFRDETFVEIRKQ